MIKTNRVLTVLILFIVVIVFIYMYNESQRSRSYKIPYPKSQFVQDIVFNWQTHKRQAIGSDNWPVTWADDNHQYSSWGDGGGFNGSNSDARVSLGIARIEGDFKNYKGYNIWGGKDSYMPAQFEGKSRGIICLGSRLYMWVTPQSNVHGYKEARLCYSDDYGKNWIRNEWAFNRQDSLSMPTFLQFGKGYSNARDNYVYTYVVRLIDDSALKVQKPGMIDLFRVQKDAMTDQNCYEYFAGINEHNQPQWSNDISLRKPVFKDVNGVGWNCAVSFNKGLQRYILTTEHIETCKGHLGIFEAKEPWGPWRTIKYVSGFGSRSIEKSTFFWNFSNKWLSDDGKFFVLVFTGIKSNDSWNTVEGQFHLEQ